MALTLESGLSIFVEKINGVEIILNDSGDFDFYMSSLSLDRKKLQSNGFKSFTQISLKEFAPLIDPLIPLSVSLTGKWTIIRKIQINEGDTDQKLLSSIFPNITASDFFIQRYDVDSNNIFLAVVRKQTLLDFLHECTALNLNIIHCTLGPFSLQSIFPLLGKEDFRQLSTTISTATYDINIEKDRITNVSTAENLNNTTQNLSGIECPSPYLISFACAFSHVSKRNDVKLNIPQIDAALSEYNYEGKFRKTGILYLFILFGLLLSNFAVFSYLNDQNKSIQAQVSLDSSTISMVDKLKKQITERQAFFAQNGISASTRTSYYADRIALSIPETITLTQINISPVKVDDDTKKLVYQPSVIKISGNAKYSMEVNEWIKTLKKMDWVKDATLVNYKQENSGANGVFDIELKLN